MDCAKQIWRGNRVNAAELMLEMKQPATSAVAYNRPILLFRRYALPLVSYYINRNTLYYNSGCRAVRLREEGNESQGRPELLT